MRTIARLREHLGRFGTRVRVRAVREVASPTEAVDTDGRVVAWLELPDRSSVNA